MSETALAHDIARRMGNELISLELQLGDARQLLRRTLPHVTDPTLSEAVSTTLATPFEPHVGRNDWADPL